MSDEPDDGRPGDDAGRTAPAPNDPEAFARWVAPHLHVLVAIANHYVDASATRHVVHGAVVQAWRVRGGFAHLRCTPSAWLAAIAVEEARRYRSRGFLGLLRVSHGQLPSLQEQALATTSRLDVEWAVRILPRRQRQVIVLRYLADVPDEDVAAALGVPLKTARARLRAAHHQLLRDDQEAAASTNQVPSDGPLREWAEQARAAATDDLPLSKWVRRASGRLH